MSKRFWVADLHLGHTKIAELRGFATVEEHDTKIIRQLTQLTKDDVVWVLGDISSGRPEGEQRALELLSNVEAQLHLIAGNHDSVSSIHRDGYKKQRDWLNVFDSIQQFGRIKLYGAQVLMSHYPYVQHGDGPGRSTARYGAYRLPDVGLPIVHGHTHQGTPHINGDDGMFCVSWEVNRGLVAERELSEWVKELRSKHAER